MAFWKTGGPHLDNKNSAIVESPIPIHCSLFNDSPNTKIPIMTVANIALLRVGSFPHFFERYSPPAKNNAESSSQVNAGTFNRVSTMTTP